MTLHTIVSLATLVALAVLLVRIALSLAGIVS